MIRGLHSGGVSDLHSGWLSDCGLHSGGVSDLEFTFRLGD